MAAANYECLKRAEVELRGCEKIVGQMSVKLTVHLMIMRRLQPVRSFENSGILPFSRGRLPLRRFKLRIGLHDDRRKSGDH